MIDLGPHAVFIIWAYLGVAIAVGVLIAWTLYDAASTDRKLTRLEASKPRRRAAK